MFDRYGSGPYRIRVAVFIQEKRKYFDIETAPIDEMPHSIYTFMELISNKVFDNTVFVHNADHVMLATPYDLDGKGEHPKSTKTLLFPEYSSDFPHVQHTIGFQGRPGGPDIYVNLEDNIENHGPGGQKHHQLVEEADPCFAKVVTNLDVLEELAKLNRKAEDENEVFVTKIESMRIIR